ncbi:MAG: hypothetical protein R3231_06960 [bacterium]|nr:hypothetical protein [bacterium]
MKIAAIVLILLMQTAAGAQDHPPGMSEKDMQKMMQAMEQMQACMEKVDQEKLNVMEARSREVGAEIESMCASGKRDEAQKKALAFGREMAQDPTLKAMRECGEGAQGMMPRMPFSDYEHEHDEDRSSHHVCD